MKFPTRATVLLGSAAFGYAGMTWLQQTRGAAPRQRTDSIFLPAGTLPATPFASLPTGVVPLPPALRAFASATGSELAAQIATALTLAGINPSWADALAAGDASGFPVLLENLGALPDGEKSVLTGFLLDRWATLDPLGGVAFFKAKNDEENLSALFRQWGQIDFATAAAKAMEYGDKCVRRTLREKARLDPAAFLTWAKAHPDINPVALFNSGIGENSEALRRLAELDPDRMLAWAKQVPEDKWNEDFPNTFASQLAKRRPEEAIAWAKSLTDSKRVEAALSGVALTLADTQPERALALVREIIARPDNESWKLFAVVEKLIPADPAAAMIMAKSFPDGLVRQNIMGRTLSSLMLQDPARAFALVDSQEAVGGLGWDHVAGYPVGNAVEAKKVMEAALQAKESSFRNTNTKGALLNWMQQDPSSIGAWLKDQMDSPLLKTLRPELQTGMALLAYQTGRPMDPELLAAIGYDPKATTRLLAERDPTKAALAMENESDPHQPQRECRSNRQNLGATRPRGYAGMGRHPNGARRARGSVASHRPALAGGRPT